MDRRQEEVEKGEEEEKPLVKREKKGKGDAGEKSSLKAGAEGGIGRGELEGRLEGVEDQTGLQLFQRFFELWLGVITVPEFYRYL